MGDVCCLDKQPQENRILDLFKMVNSDSASNKYLHKKFKKVATLEDPSPPKKESPFIYSLPSEESDDVAPLRTTSSPPSNNDILHLGASQPPGTAANCGSGGGRYVCPYCKLSCAKPSVLRKHIRAHTNERPYPCLPCGFAFKTKSNLYKHCRSRAHTLKADGQSSDDDDTSQPSSIEIANKPYKPKFHLSELSDSALSNSPPFSSSPSPDLLNVHINKLITENHAIVEESEWTPAFKKHSPLSSPPLKNGDSKILELALTNYHSSEPEDLSSSSTAEPLNLTLREPRKRPISETFNLVTDVKEPPAKAKEKITLSRMVDEILHHCPHCKVVFGTVDNLNTHLYSCKPKTSPGPLLGRTPLVESFKDNIKKRRVDFNKVDSVKQTSVKLFGGEVHILDSPAEEGGFGRLLGSRKESFAESMSKKDGQVMTISKTGLHSVGGTMIQSESADPPTCSSYHEKMVLPLPHVAPPNLKVPGITTPIQFPQLRLSSAALSPLTSITAFNPLTLPPSTTLTPLKTTPVSQYNGGVVTILHDGKAIPFVPGMPGPNSLLSSPPPPPPLPLLASNQSRPLLDTTVIVKAATKPDLPIKPMQSVSRTVESGPEFVNPEIKKPLTVPTTRLEVKERKFLRPSTLPLKPGTYTPKRPLTTPQHTTSLVSPETPRPRKSYGQLYLNGHAYTYLGLKCSTRMFFCTLNKPQPIYVPLSPDQYKVSMYSNWTICSDSSPTPPGMDTRRAMSCYDSRNRPSCFTVANKNKQDLITHSTYRSIVPDSENSNASDKASGEDDDPSTRKLKVCEGGYESNEDYTYIRGRGRGKFVCKECGIRCKKPSMLKKHIRTHTDLRPYTCKYCDFSFKTKGNLTKHMKSKAHYKRCVELDISPVPTSLENSPDDDESGKQDEWGAGTNEDESDEETEDDEDDEDEDSEEEGEECRMEREAARSLLSLSEVTLETAHRQYMCAGLVSHSSRPRSYPYALSPQGELPQSSEKLAKADSWRVDMLSLMKDCRDVVVNTTTLARPTTVDSPAPPDSVRPIDLSSKSSGGHTPVIKSIGDQALLLASICSTTEKLPTTPTTDYPEDSHLLHAYLTEKALRDSKIKLHQQAERKRLMQEIKTTEEEANKVAESSPVKDESETNDGIIPVVTCCSSNFRAPQDSVVSPGSPPPAMNKGKLKAEFMPPSSGPALSFISSTEDGKSMCGVCNKVFNKPSQLRLHVNIHYFERPYRCESCAVSFRTKGHLQKHQRSLSHLNKVNMNSTFGTATTSNPRPFKCDDCKIAFRIHGHLAKHFRSKMHIMKLECLGKLPFGTYAELERSGVNMNDIDTTDCENSLESLQILAQKLYEKDGSTVARLNSSSGAPPSLTATSADSGGGESEERITRLSESSSIGSDDECPIMTTSSSSASEQISSDSGVGRERVDGLRETDDVGVR